MTTRACRSAAVVALAIGCPALIAGAQGPVPPPRDIARPAPDPTVAAGIVRGHVVDADTGLPLRRVSVSLRNDREPKGFSASTDAEGAFAFDAVPAGRYRLKAAKARYVDAAFGARRAGGTGRAFEVSDGQTIDDLVVRLAIAGVITGRVLDDAGEPVVRASVWATRRERNGRAPSGQTTSDTTDDTGTFRLFGLPAGPYTLAARLDDQGGQDGTVDTSGVGLVTTYHPGTPLPSEAQPVDVVPGVDTFADVTLIVTKVTTVSGDITDTRGRTPMGGFVMLASAGDDGMPHSGPTTSVLPGGHFTVSGVAPGDYVLSVRAFFDESEILRIVGSGTIDDTAFTMPLSVPAAPLADVRIVITPTVDLQGRVLLDGAPPPAGSVIVAATAAGQTEGMDGARIPAGADGRFTLRVRPGRWQIGPVSTSKWMPLRMTFRGRALEPLAPIDVTGDPDERLEIQMTAQLTVVTGTARDAHDVPQRDYHAVIFPADREREGTARYANRPRVERADGDGRFRFEGLLPGAYFVAAVADFDPEESLDDELIESLRPTATPVRVTRDPIAPLSLKVAPLP